MSSQIKQTNSKLFSNYYEIYLSKDTIICDYKVQLSGDSKITLDNMEPERKKIFSQQIRKLLSEQKEQFKDIGKQYLNEKLYIAYKQGQSNIPGQTLELGEIQFEDKTYKVTLEKIREIPHSDEIVKNIVGRIMKSVSENNLNLRKSGKKFFNQDDFEKFTQEKVKILRGYDICIKSKNNAMYMQIESCVKTVRSENFENILRSMGNNIQEAQGITIMTEYNSNFYRVEEICTDLSPQSSFTDRSGKEKTYLQYYADNYKIQIRNPNQPLIKSIVKRRGKEQTVYLIPELCLPTGETNQMRADFNFQKNISRVKHSNACQKLEQNTKYQKLLVQELKKLKSWNLEIQDKPTQVVEKKINPGYLLMGKNKQIDIQTGNLDRETQTNMYRNSHQGKGLNYIQILYSRNDQNAFQSVMNQLQQSCQTMSFQLSQAPLGTVVQDDRNEKSWIDALDKKSELIILLLPGPKKNGRHYTALKRYLVNQLGIPSQVLLVSTAKNQKGLRTVINKLLVQITAKTQGVPYTVSDIPSNFSKKPTMICGIDIYHKASMGQQSILGIVATIDSSYGSYASEVQVLKSNIDIGSDIQDVFTKIIDAFGQKNRVAPSNIIVYRDGVSTGQYNTIIDTEMKAINQVLQKFQNKTFDQQPSKLTYIIVNKRISTKFYLSNSDDIRQANSAQTGTIVDEKLNDSNLDFYIVSQKAKQGVAIPTHYSILQDSQDKKLQQDYIDDIKVLTYKMCFLYFNMTGAIKVPAPIQYAHVLSNFVGDRYDYKNPKTLIAPIESFKKQNTLYFI